MQVDGKIKTKTPACNIGLLPWLCAASWRSVISYATRPANIHYFRCAPRQQALDVIRNANHINIGGVMRRTLTLHLVPFTLALLIFGCKRPSSTLTESQKAAIADTLQGINNEFAAGANVLDVDRALNYFTDDSDLT